MRTLQKECRPFEEHYPFPILEGLNSVHRRSPKFFPLTLCPAVTVIEYAPAAVDRRKPAFIVSRTTYLPALTVK